MIHKEFLEPFLYGLGIGILAVIAVYVREYLKRRQYKKQIKTLKNHLHQKMEIEAEALDFKKRENQNLKKENENLRITNQALLQKPDRKQIFMLHTYQKAIDKMSESMVGFAPAWQKSLKEAEAEAAEIQEGKKTFIQRIIPRQFLPSHTAIEIAEDSSDSRSEE